MSPQSTAVACTGARLEIGRISKKWRMHSKDATAARKDAPCMNGDFSLRYTEDDAYEHHKLLGIWLDMRYCCGSADARGCLHSEHDWLHSRHSTRCMLGCCCCASIRGLRLVRRPIVEPDFCPSTDLGCALPLIVARRGPCPGALCLTTTRALRVCSPHARRQRCATP